jgi:hypothetical protein
MKLDRMPEVRVADWKALALSGNAQKWESGASRNVTNRSIGAAPMAGIADPF